MQEQGSGNRSDSQSFYSLDNSKTQFTVIVESQPELGKPTSSKLVNLYGIKQSSALMASESNQLNKSMHTIYMEQDNEFEGMNINEISGIGNTQAEQLECSACLEKEISCLTVSKQPSPEERRQLEAKIEGLKVDQSMLRKQIEVFQGLMSVTQSASGNMMKDLMQASRFIKKRCEHSGAVSSPFNFEWPDPSQVSIRTLQQSTVPNTEPKSAIKHYDIKPNKNSSEAEQRLKELYKASSFGNHIVLLDDSENEYRVEVFYEKEAVVVEVINYTKGETNYVYGAKFNENLDEGNQRISEKLVFPFKKYLQKKFTLSLNILLLIFEQGQVKVEKNLIKIEEIRTVSVPLPLSCVIESRFVGLGGRDKMVARLEKKMYIYQIDLNYGIDLEAYGKLKKCEWVRNKWISLKGSPRLLKVDFQELQQKENDFKLLFRIGVQEKDSQEAIDLIEYLCFMLAQ